MFWRREKILEMRADELAIAIKENRAPRLVDVRSQKDFQASHLPGAINIPLEDLEQRQAELDAEKPTVFY
jgi:rhodanese-related sulfurtransferase